MFRLLKLFDINMSNQDQECSLINNIKMDFNDEKTYIKELHGKCEECFIDRGVSYFINNPNFFRYLSDLLKIGGKLYYDVSTMIHIIDQNKNW